MKKFLLFITITSLIFIACRKEFDYSAENKPKINVACMLGANNIINVQISYTLATDDFDYQIVENVSIKNAEVYIYEDNQLKEKLIYDTLSEYHNKFGYYKTKHFVPSINRTYQLKVVVPGYDTVFARTYIPDTVNIDSLSFRYFTKDDINGKFYHFIFGINFYDQAHTVNYYCLNEGFNYFYSYDPIIESMTNNGVYFSSMVEGSRVHGSDLNKCFFSDSLISGNNYCLFIDVVCAEGLVPLYNGSYIVFPFEFQNLSQDAYLYYKTSNIYAKTHENPLTEPVQIYSNIKNGTGIFAGYSSSVDTFYLTSNMLNK